MERADLVVVGAGPAGATAAITARRLRPGWRVVMIDRAAFPRDKACGDAIAWHAFAELARIGVTGVEGDAPPVDTLELTTPTGERARGTGRRANRVIPRTTFDARLVDHAVAAGVELVHHRVRDLTVDVDRVVVDGRFAAPHLIAADGATSVVRRRLGVPPAADRHRAVAARAYAPAEPGQSHQRIDVAGTGWPAYAWSFPLGDGRANVGFGMRVDAARDRLDGRVRRTLEEGTRAAAAGPLEPGSLAVHPLPLSTGRPRPDHGRVLLVGDAAGLINPLTGEGIFYAVASGRMAATALALAPDAPGPLYRRMIRRRFGRHFATTAALARLLDLPAAMSVAMAAAQDPAVYDDIAEIGLGEGVLTPRLVWALTRSIGAASTRDRP
ncbi:NAD(P)/FAD-dependent oxidoreductase [Euzebya sp.]|uniref:NAD(P)/FAD-dependent oxidoreductase n=1 Tax=Euzebya sp. TaxID=1971409 RepID=UPI003514E5C0